MGILEGYQLDNVGEFFFRELPNLVVMLTDSLEDHGWNPADVSIVFNHQVGSAAHQVVTCCKKFSLLILVLQILFLFSSWRVPIVKTMEFDHPAVPHQNGR